MRGVNQDAPMDRAIWVDGVELLLISQYIAFNYT